jgi:hypothetical protein
VAPAPPAKRPGGHGSQPPPPANPGAHATQPPAPLRLEPATHGEPVAVGVGNALEAAALLDGGGEAVAGNGDSDGAPGDCDGAPDGAGAAVAPPLPLAQPLPLAPPLPLSTALPVLLGTPLGAHTAEALPLLPPPLAVALTDEQGDDRGLRLARALVALDDAVRDALGQGEALTADMVTVVVPVAARDASAKPVAVELSDSVTLALEDEPEALLVSVALEEEEPLELEVEEPLADSVTPALADGEHEALLVPVEEAVAWRRRAPLLAPPENLVARTRKSKSLIESARYYIRNP